MKNTERTILLMYWYNVGMFKNTGKLTFFKTVTEVFTYEISEKASIWFNNLIRNITLLRSLFYIQGFDNPSLITSLELVSLKVKFASKLLLFIFVILALF